MQALREQIAHIDAVLYTHYHSDHTLGLEDLRGYNFKQGGAIPIYGSASTLAQIQRIFDYIFTPDPTYVGGQVPQVSCNEIPLFGTLTLFEETIEVFDLIHGNISVSGFKFGSFAYATDCKGLPERTKKLLSGIDTLILDGLRYEQHQAHFTIPEAIATAQELGVRRTILTHMTHGVEFDAVSSKLPAGIELAYDGMKLTW
jgi:phosphoribosyl 1,2-cyclic phosphate phosphodiesterase